MDPDRPVSPHLQIYRWPLAMVISILHRITGAALAVGALLLVVILLSIAVGPGAYDVLRTYISTGPGQAFLILWTLALFLHLFNGVRHLVFDAGLGFGIEATRISGIVVLLATVVFTVAVWLVAWLHNGIQA
ncbi:MAG: succinate dehydrogenase, cytochrome b556 subunit [Proteobacteria bacterium]|nr:succinate dehydrogenase, cytochrome b556 subunit [Pseudomonadota bacterium]